jgi:MFS family permease
LGTDSWIQNITGNLFSSGEGKALFLWTSAIMFGLRFCAHWIETKLNLKPIALLLVCSVIACIGLNLSSNMTSFPLALLALGVYAVGKTFFWPTMLAVVGDRYPKSGAVAMSIMGGIGMLSAGLIGGPGLGYVKDRFAGESMRGVDVQMAEQYKADNPSTFLNIDSTAVYGLNGKAVEEARAVEVADRNETQAKLVKASEEGDRKALRIDSFIPATMALIYLGLLFYYKGIGGYRPLRIDEEQV